MRTPLAAWFRTELVRYRRRQAGLSTDGPTRRGALAALATASAAKLSGCVTITPHATPDSGTNENTTNPDHDRILILGGGIAGLNCCHQLAKLGITAEVFEASDRFGGRMYSDTGRFDGAPDETVELGGEWVNSADLDLLELITELELELLDTFTEEFKELIWYQDERREPGGVWESVVPIIEAVDAALAELGDTDISYANPGTASDLDNTSVADWLSHTGLAPRAVWLVNTLMTGDYGLETSEQSALNLLFYLGTFETDYDERYQVNGGVQQIPNALAEMYADRVHLAKSATAIAQNDDGTYAVSFSDGTTETCGFLVSALPFTILREIAIDLELPEAKSKCIAELGYGTNAKLILPFATRIWQESHESGYTFTDTGAQAGWDSWSQSYGDFGAFANFLGGTAGAQLGAGDETEQAATLLAQLELFWPGADAAWLGEVARQVWTDVETAKGSYACYTLGQWTTVAGAEAESVGNFFFCGEHTSWEFQGYMNGAAESGRRAAEEVTAAYRGTARIAHPVRACRRRPLVMRA